MDVRKTVQPLILNSFMTTPATTQNAVDPFEIMKARKDGRHAQGHLSMLPAGSGAVHARLGSASSRTNARPIAANARSSTAPLTRADGHS